VLFRLATPISPNGSPVFTPTTYYELKCPLNAPDMSACYQVVTSGCYPGGKILFVDCMAANRRALCTHVHMHTHTHARTHARTSAARPGRFLR
jgi:hypothetical protein